MIPQGLVPVGLTLLGVDQEVKVWFAARYLHEDLQLLVAPAFIGGGGLAIWLAESIKRRGVNGARQTATAE